MHPNKIYFDEKGVLYLVGTAGFFSNCSVALYFIVAYANKFKRCPSAVDFSQVFQSYKDNPEHDVYTEYFQVKEDARIPADVNIVMNWHSQFDYRMEPYAALKPFVEHYFTPSDVVASIAEDIHATYNIDFGNTLAICYRGTDKHTETVLCSFQGFIDEAKRYLLLNPGMRVLVQTDQEQFLEHCYRELDNVFHIKELPVTSTTKAMQLHIDPVAKVVWAQRFLAAVLLISKIRYVINHTGNVGRWICLYRGNAKGMSQFLRQQYNPADEENLFWVRSADASRAP